MKRCFDTAILSMLLMGRLLAAETKALYENSFEGAALGKVPDDMLVLDGAFAVKEERGNRFLELPGAPLETYGVLFGPTQTNGLAVQARIYSTGKGRRFPTCAVGLNGVGGYRLQVSPAKKALELAKADAVLAAVPFTWQSGSWTILRLQTRKISNEEVRIEGKAWTQDAAEPKEWTISRTDKTEAPAGRPSIWGSPYAGTPIRFDDLQVIHATE